MKLAKIGASAYELHIRNAEGSDVRVLFSYEVAIAVIIRDGDGVTAAFRIDEIVSRTSRRHENAFFSGYSGEIESVPADVMEEVVSGYSNTIAAQVAI